MSKSSVILNCLFVSGALFLSIAVELPSLAYFGVLITTVFVTCRAARVLGKCNDGSRRWVGAVSMVFALLAVGLWWYTKVPTPLVAYFALVLAVDGIDVDLPTRLVRMRPAVVGLLLGTVQLGIFSQQLVDRLTERKQGSGTKVAISA
jgi:hypothetical protein